MSDYFFTDGESKGRLVRIGDNFYVGEWRSLDPDAQWFPWICGTREWLGGLSDQEVEWATKNAKGKFK